MPPSLPKPYGYLTPDEFTPTDYICGRLRIPNNQLFQAAVMGVLNDLCRAESWEAFGTMTPEDAAYLALTMYNDFVENRGDCMIGMIVPCARETLPPNVLLCDGTEYNRVDYPRLYAVLADAYKTGADTFITPNLDTRFIMGGGNEEYPNFSEGGASEVELEDANLASHSHGVSPHNHGIEGFINTTVPAGVDPIPASFMVGFPSATADNLPSDTDQAGDGEPFSILPPYIVIPYVIIAK